MPVRPPARPRLACSPAGPPARALGLLPPRQPADRAILRLTISVAH